MVMRRDELDKLLRRIMEWVLKYGELKFYEKIKDFRTEYAKEQLRKYYPPEVVNSATVKFVDNILTIHWKSELPNEIRSEFLIDIESELSICLTCETVLMGIIKEFLCSGSIKIDKESIGLCEDYWKQLTSYLERQQDV